MKSKSIMLIVLILLTVLTLGSVSASDDADFNETLTAEQTHEVSLDASVADELNEGDGNYSGFTDNVLQTGEITRDNLHSFVSHYEAASADHNPWIVTVHGDDIVHDGGINITIFKDKPIFSEFKSFGEYADENNDIVWYLDELRDKDTLNDVGTYTISVKYLSDETEIDLGEYEFALTQFNYNTRGGEFYKDCPFEIITVFDEAYVEVYVNGKDEPYTVEDGNQIAWTLSDLDITSVGDYNINIVAYDDGDVVDNFTFSLNVVDSIDWFGAYSPVEVQADDLEDPLVYLYSPDGQIGESINMYLNDDFLCDFVVESNWMGWTLDDLGIEENGGYNVRFENGDGYLCDAWLNVNGIINEHNFNPWVSIREPAGADWNPEIVNVWGDDNVRQGSINISIVKDDNSFSEVKPFGDDENVIWTLDELRDKDILNDVGTYTISVKYLSDETEIDLGEYEFALTQFNYNTRGGEFYKDCPFEIITVFDEAYVEVYVNGKDEPYTVEDGNQIAWTLSDLDITSVGDYNINIVAYDDGDVVDNFTFSLNVVDSIDWFGAYSPVEVQADDLEDPLVYLYSPDGQIGESINMYLNDDFLCDFVVESNWMGWTLDDLGIEENGEYNVRFENGDGYLCDAWLNVNAFKEFSVDVWVSEESSLYTDTVSPVIHIDIHEGMFGMLDVIVDNVVKYHTKLVSESGSEDGFNGYEWDLRYLGITEAGLHNVTLKFEIDGAETVKEYLLDVADFDNSTFRAQVRGSDEPYYLYLFTPAGETGTAIFTFKGWDDDNEKEVIRGNLTLELNESYWNKWVLIDYYMDYDCNRVDISIDGDEIGVEYSLNEMGVGNYFQVSYDKIYSPEDIVIYVSANTTDNNYTVSITSGDEEFLVNVTDLGDYEWVNGFYSYSITLEDLDSFFSKLNDKDKILIFYDVGGGKSIAYRERPYNTFTIQKEDDFIRLHKYSDLRINLIGIGWAHDEDEEYDDDNIVIISVPDVLNIHETALVHFKYGEREITKSLSDLYGEYDYEFLGVNYYVTWNDLNLENVQGSYALNISVTADDKVIGFNNYFISFDDEEGWGIDDYDDSIGLTLYYGQIGDLEFGMDGNPDMIIRLTIPKYLNITEGTIVISEESGEVIFEKSLSEFGENYTSFDDVQSDYYWISDKVTEFDYSIFKENVPFTVSFAYGNITKVHAKGVRVEDRLLRINTPEVVAEFFKITVSDGILVNGTENAIIIECTDSANRQSVPIEMGRGYFVVYVNDKKVEDLGRLIRVDDETELDIYRLEGGSEGVTKLIIYLSDLNITDNGFYNIRVAHHADGGGTGAEAEVELFNQNITLTSNVKVDNVTSEVFTGFGMDPILLYLDTYYGNINETSGKITVLNSESDEIFTKDIKTLSKDEKGRYYLKYSDFEGSNFGDIITVMYADGNERSGNTTVNVTWKDVDSDVFNPVVNINVEDYYGDFVNLDIPELLNTGQIIVTVKFKNNRNSQISNMNVTTDFGSQAVYIFDITDIKVNYNNDFNLALSDLGFYEVNGDYEADVQFTAGTDLLDITNNTLKVELSKDILININRTSRYANTLPFATVQIFEPISAYAELYIDGVLNDHKTFEKGLITFDSFADWAPGNHTVEIRVCDSEFGTLLNSSATSFETLIQSGDVEIIMDEVVKETEEVLITINVPKASVAVIQIDNGDKVPYTLNAGENTINLGVLSYGNHTVGIAYNTTLDDGSPSFYTNYLSLFVGDDGHWLQLPEPLILDHDDIIKMNFGPDAQGNVIVLIDGAVVANQTLINGTADVSLTDLISGVNKYGQHTYNITYSGDKTHDSLSKSGVFNVTYLFKDNLVKEGFPLKDYYNIIITLPEDAKGSVDLSVNGKKFTSNVDSGKATFKVPDLTMGEHDVIVSYSGDDKYPAGSYNNILNVSYFAVTGEIENTQCMVSLVLPSNATGNLVVYNNNRKSQLFLKAVENGRASIDLTSLTVGKYDLRIYYDGSDYDVKEFTTQFDVLPKIYISQNITVGDIGQIFVDLDNSTGHLLILVDGLSPVLLEIEEGIVNYTFDTEGLSKGNHSVSFQYFGNSFDGNIFYAENQKTGYPMPIYYNMYLLPKSPQVNMTAGDDWVVVDCGNATGTIEVFVDGVSKGIFNIVNGIALIDLSQVKNGNYNITFMYSGDSVYDGFTRDMVVSVNHKVPSITAKNAKVLYSSKGKYSVTVYDKDGNVSEGVKVSFIIGGKVYKTSKTNSKGVATIVIGKNPGTYKVTVKALDVNVTKTLTVKHLLTLKKVTVKRSAKNLILTATLAKVNKKYLKNKKVTFKFNGKKYTAKTNKKGVAKVTIKSSVLKKLKVGKKVKYQATYLKDTVKRSIKVKK